MAEEKRKLTALLSERQCAENNLSSGDYYRSKTAMVLFKALKELHPDYDWSEIEKYLAKEVEADGYRATINEIDELIESGEYDDDTQTSPISLLNK